MALCVDFTTSLGKSPEFSARIPTGGLTRFVPPADKKSRKELAENFLSFLKNIGKEKEITYLCSVTYCDYSPTNSGRLFLSFLFPNAKIVNSSNIASVFNGNFQ